jgi:hypothetical protein
MSLTQRLTVLAFTAALAGASYAVARHYSLALIAYVVEHSLAEKAPAGTDPSLLSQGLERRVYACPNREAKLQTLLTVSSYLEKVQALTQGELDELLGKGWVRDSN